MARKIRLRYTGLVAFASRVFSILTGLAFVTIVTRNLPLTGFGVWQYISLLISYVIFPSSILNYWVTRDVARGFKVAKINLTMNLAFSLLGFVIFFPISPYVAKTVNADPAYFMIGSLMIPTMYMVSSLEAIAAGCIPHITSYGFVAFEITKVIFGFITILYMKLGLYGAIITILVAYLTQTIFLFVNLRSYIGEGSVNWNAAKKWLRMGWIPLYSSLGGVLAGLDVFIITLLTFSSEPLAFLRASGFISMVISYSGVLASALYPRLLAGGSEKDVETSFKLVLMFAVPSAVGAILLAEPLLHIFNPEYVVAATILRVSTLNIFLGCIGTILNSVVIGTEKVDVEDASFGKLIRSRLFLLPSLYYIYVSIYLPIVYVVTALIINLRIEPVYLNVGVAINLVGLLVSASILAYTYRIAKRTLPFKLPVKSLTKYVLASIAMVSIIIPFYPQKFVQTMTSVTIGAIAYFLVLIGIDKDARDLIRQILSTFKTARA